MKVLLVIITLLAVGCTSVRAQPPVPTLPIDEGMVTQTEFDAEMNRLEALINSAVDTRILTNVHIQGLRDRVASVEELAATKVGHPGSCPAVSFDAFHFETDKYVEDRILDVGKWFVVFDCSGWEPFILDIDGSGTTEHLCNVHAPHHTAWLSEHTILTDYCTDDRYHFVHDGTEWTRHHEPTHGPLPTAPND